MLIPLLIGDALVERRKVKSKKEEK